MLHKHCSYLTYEFDKDEVVSELELVVGQLEPTRADNNNSIED